MAQTDVVLKIDSERRDRETDGISHISSDVSTKEAQNSLEKGTGSVLPGETKICDQGNSQPTSRLKNTTFSKRVVSSVKQRAENSSKVTILQLVILVWIVGALLCSLLISKLKRMELWALSLWKWALMALVLISGRLVSGWIIWIVVYFMEQNYILKKRVLYFVYVLREPVRNCFWLSIVLVVWILGIDSKLEKKTKSRVLPYITKILVCLIISYFIWLLKILLVKVLVMSFHIKAFFEELRQALFNQHVIKNLYLPPKSERKIVSIQGVNECFTFKNSGGFFKQLGHGKEEGLSTSHFLHRGKKDISAWTMKRMRKSIKRRDFLVLNKDSNATNESYMEIKTDREAIEAAKSIFRHVIKKRHDDELIFMEDVKHYMPEAEAKKFMQNFHEADNGVNLSSFCNWMVGAYKQRKALSVSLSKTKSAVDDLRTKFNIFTIVVIIMFWFIILGLRAPNLLVYMGAQLLVVAFIFGNTCKTVFEGFVFLFVIHPFNVGDLCEVDGVQMVVKKMKLFSTVFIRYDNQKIMFPNSVLAIKPITNYHRSRDVKEVVDIFVDFSTQMAKIQSMKEQIQKYVEEKGEQRGYMSLGMVVKDMGERNKVKMSLVMEYKRNSQKMEERFERRAALVEAISKAMKDLDL